MLTLKSDRMDKSKNIASLLYTISTSGTLPWHRLRLDVSGYKEYSALAFDAIHFISKVKGFVNAHDEWQNLLHYEVKVLKTDIRVTVLFQTILHISSSLELFLG